MAGLVDLAREINGIARSTIEGDGEHAAMFFLRLEGGDLEVHLFDEAAERPVGEARARQLAEAVASRRADAVVFVSEAWSARPEAIPEGGGAGDAPDATDVLLVAAADREGNRVALETPIFRRANGTLDLGETEEDADVHVYALDEVASVWRLQES